MAPGGRLGWLRVEQRGNRAQQGVGGVRAEAGDLSQMLAQHVGPRLGVVQTTQAGGGHRRVQLGPDERPQYGGVDVELGVAAGGALVAAFEAIDVAGALKVLQVATDGAGRRATERVDFVDALDNRCLREWLRTLAQHPHDQVAHDAVAVPALESHRQWHRTRSGAVHLRQRPMQDHQVAQRGLCERLTPLAQRLADDRSRALVVVGQDVERLALDGAIVLREPCLKL